MPRDESWKKPLSWEKQFPSLEGKYTHWWLEGDGGLVFVSDDLAELIEVVKENYGKSLKIYCYRAYHNDNGDLVADEKARFEIADVVKDRVAEQRRSGSYV